MITFRDIAIKGFGSIKDLGYQLDSPGINLITGSNGAGKTTIFSALTWCLYGQTLKGKADVTPWEDTQDKDYKGTMVSVNLVAHGKNIWVGRTKDYTGNKAYKGNKIYLNIDGVSQPIRDKRELQAKIIELLGMSFNLFKNSIAFGQNLTRLLKESGPRQKEIFDEAFDVVYINKARDKAAKYYSELSKNYDEIVNKLDSLNKVIEKQTETLRAYEEQKEEAKKNIQSLQKELEENVQKIKAEEVAKKNQKGHELRALQIREKVEKLRDLENKHFRLDLTHEQEVEETKALKKRCNELAINLAKREPVCDRCGQTLKGSAAALGKERYKKELKEKRVELNTRLKEDEERRKELAQLTSSIGNLQSYKDEQKKIQKLLDAEKNNDRLLVELKAARLKLEGKVKEAKIRYKRAKKAMTEQDLTPLYAKQEKLAKQVMKGEKEIRLHRWLIDDPLSNKGLKAFIFKVMLQQVNNQLKKYGKYLGYSINFSVDLESSNKNFETQVYSKGNIRPYEDLSGGQNQLVDVCLAFAIHDTITETKKLNLLLMDEVFESLDANNIELVSELIELKALKTSVHLISHQQNLVFSKVAKTTHLQLVNGRTIAL